MSYLTVAITYAAVSGLFSKGDCPNGQCPVNVRSKVVHKEKAAALAGVAKTTTRPGKDFPAFAAAESKGKRKPFRKVGRALFGRKSRGCP